MKNWRVITLIIGLSGFVTLTGYVWHSGSPLHYQSYFVPYHYQSDFVPYPVKSYLGPDPAKNGRTILICDYSLVPVEKGTSGYQFYNCGPVDNRFGTTTYEYDYVPHAPGKTSDTMTSHTDLTPPSTNKP